MKLLNLRTRPTTTKCTFYIRTLPDPPSSTLLDPPRPPLNCLETRSRSSWILSLGGLQGLNATTTTTTFDSCLCVCCSFPLHYMTFAHLLLPSLTFSGLREPSRTFSNLLEPSRTFSSLLEPSRTFSNLLEPSRTFSHPLLSVSTW